jgi:hypothetical protein
MMRGSKLVLVLALCAPVGVAAQSEKEVSCTYQAAVVGAVQQARLDDVSQDAVQAHVTEAAMWPEKFNAIIPIVTPWVYELPAQDLQSNDLAQVWNEGCLNQ